MEKVCQISGAQVVNIYRAGNECKWPPIVSFPFNFRLDFESESSENCLNFGVGDWILEIHFD